MVYVASAFMFLAALVAVANIGGWVTATKGRGYSAIPLLSLVFCTIAFLTARETFAAWAFLPALLDPGTWVLAVLPGFLIYRLIVNRQKSA